MARVKASVKLAAFVLAALAAALAPLLPWRNQTAAADVRFAGWPVAYEGRALTEMPLTQREIAFARDFPGRIRRFSDGKREIIIRWIGVPNIPPRIVCAASATVSRRSLREGMSTAMPWAVFVQVTVQTS